MQFAQRKRFCSTTFLLKKTGFKMIDQDKGTDPFSNVL